jgi:hypothetical protein
MKKIYLHIGMHKTGTSAIQASLKNNEDSLSKQNWQYIWLPDYKEIYRYIHDTSNYDVPYKDAKNTLDKILKNTDHDNILISSEDMTGSFHSIELWRHKAKRINDLFSDIPSPNLQFIMLYRRQDDFYESAFQQRAKGGLNQTFNELLKELPPLEVMDWHANVQTFLNTFPECKFTIEPYDEICSENGVISFFSNLLNINLIRTTLSEEMKNQKSVLLTRYFALYGTLFSRERISKLSNNLYKYEQGIGLRKAQLLSYEDRAAIYNYYKPSNEKLLFYSKNPKNQFIKNWEKDLEKDKHSSGIISKRSFTKDIIRVLEKVLNEKV